MSPTWRAGACCDAVRWRERQQQALEMGAMRCLGVRVCGRVGLLSPGLSGAHCTLGVQVCARLGLVSLAYLWRQPQAALLR